MSAKRNEKKMKPVRRSLAAVLMAAVLLAVSACGSSDEDDVLEAYRASMEGYYNEISEINDAINNIDPGSENARAELLEELDRLNGVVSGMSELTVPEEFSEMGDLPASAADYMEKAVTAYHQAYDGEFDANAEALATEYYERANLRIRYILAILHGDDQMPEG